jgi:hypothetical protein
MQVPQNPSLPKCNFDLECIYNLTNKKNPKAPLYIDIEYIDQRVKLKKSEGLFMKEKK